MIAATFHGNVGHNFAIVICNVAVVFVSGLVPTDIPEQSGQIVKTSESIGNWIPTQFLPQTPREWSLFLWSKKNRTKLRTVFRIRHVKMAIPSTQSADVFISYLSNPPSNAPRIHTSERFPFRLNLA